MKTIILALFIGLSAFVSAQNCQVGNSCNGTVSASDGGNCTTANACVSLPLAQNTGAVGLSLGGTFTATIQFEASADNGATWNGISGTPLGSTTTQLAATGVGAWRFAVSGLTNIRVRGSAYTSGTAAVTFQTSPTAASLGGGGAGITTFDQLGAGTNTGNAFGIGAGGTLSPTGGGTITANVGSFLNGTLNAFPIFTGTTGANNLGTSLLTTDLTTLTSSYTGGLNVAGSGSGCITLSGLTSGSAKFCVPAVAGTPNQGNFPTTTGAAGQFLISDGGNPQQFSWSNYFKNNAQTGTYQVVAADFQLCKTIPVASGTFTVTLVASGSQPGDGQCIRILNYGNGTVTVARSGQNINGAAANLTIAAGSASAPNGLLIVSDAANYFAQPLGSGSGSSTPCTVTASSLQYNNAGAFGCVTDFTFSGHTITSAAAGLLDLSAQTGIGSFKVPVVAGFVPTANGSLGYDSTANLFVGGVNGSTGKLPYFTGANPTNNDCAKWTTGGVLADFGAACNPVTSVFSRTGAVVAAANDYTLDQLAAAAAAWTTANADQPLTFNFASTTSGRVSFKIAEGTASTSAGTPYLAQIATILGSTATPLDIQQSETGSQAVPMLKLEPTLNTSGSPDMFTILETDTSSGASTNFIHLKGGASAATDEFIVSKSGTISANGSYGATATSSIVTLRGAGAHIESTATAIPTVTAGCGTSPVVQTGATDNSFRLNVGTGGSATSCTVTFQKAFTNIPACNVTPESGTVFNHTAAPTTTTVVITAASAWAASTVLDVNCHI